MAVRLPVFRVQVEGVQRGLLLIGDQLVDFTRRDDDDAGEGQITVRPTHLVQESRPGLRRKGDASQHRSAFSS
ncbi:hypothetical protein [Streptomyces rubiginosohelvolus]|uniref:Uncharacterized protein n=1 Tax=Streptomyces rubiginosohelvolus TaxID=67362 RepID=A0ABW6F9M9_9ACTN